MHMHISLWNELKNEQAACSFFSIRKNGDFFFLGKQVFACVKVCDTESMCERGKFKETQGTKTWIHVCLFASYALCVWLFGRCGVSFHAISVCVFVHIDTQIVYLPRSAWLHWLVFGHRAWLPFCKHNQAKMYALNLFIHTNTHKHKAPGNNDAQPAPMCRQNCVDTHTVFIFTWRILP